MEKIMRSIVNWARDPFGKNKIVDAHEKIIRDMKVVKTEAQNIIVRSEFPLGHLVGNTNYRRRQHARNTKHVRKSL